LGQTISTKIYEQVSNYPGKRRAIIIGVSDYEDNSLRELDFCRNDAAKMLEILEKLGYEIADNHKLMGYVKYDVMREAIYDFFDNKKSGAEDTLLFYYSGHGIPTSRGSTVLASSEIDHDAPNRKGFSSYELTNLIQDSAAIRIVEILDCCYSGSAKVGKGFEELGKGLDKGAAEDTAATLGTEAIENNAKMLREQGEGKCLLAASQAAQEAYGLKEKGHSIFTYYLLEGLNQNKKSIDSNGIVTPHTLGNYVYREIMSLPENKRPRQKPIIKAEAVGDIILAYYPELLDISDQHSLEESLINRGLQYFENEEYTNAISSFDEALKINPKNQRAYNHKGDAFFKQGSYEEAIKCYDEALKINPKYLDVLKDKGLALERLGKENDAIKCYDEALKIKPDYHEAEYAKKTLLLRSSSSNPDKRALSEIRKSTTPHFATSWTPYGRGLANTTLSGVAVDSLVCVYFAGWNGFDTTHTWIQKFDSNGNFITTWGSDDYPYYDKIGLNFKEIPYGIAIGPGDYVYLTTYSLKTCIQKFDSNGEFIDGWGSNGKRTGQFGKFPRGITVDSSGYVYVVDQDHNRIQKFDSNGEFITTWGSKGRNYQQFDKPYGVTVDRSNNLYVSDHDNHRVQKFDSNGNFILSWGSQGESNGQFKYTSGVATDSAGNVYVCDEKNHRVQKFDSNGNFITTWGGKGKGPGQFDGPSYIATDLAGNVYVVDPGNRRVQKFVDHD
jgi:DNA-binding beta-propeller fold protein YncE